VTGDHLIARAEFEGSQARSVMSEDRLSEPAVPGQTLSPRPSLR
jgi:hypothetical protein